MFSNGDKVVIDKLLSQKEFEDRGLKLDNPEHREALARRKKNAIGTVLGHVPRYESYYRVKIGTVVAIYHIAELVLKK